MPTLDVTLPALHDSQQAVADSAARFRVLACGRRWGKTRLGSALCLETALHGGRAWWVAPSYPVATVGWRLVHRLGSQIPGANIRLSERLIELPTGGEVRVRSADNPDSLRGEGLDLAVLDECAFIKEAAWNEAIRPALSDRQGRAVFISTPKGRNWFWRAFQTGMDDQSGEWQSWHLPTADSPYIDAGEIEAARKSLPERIFRQEYLAEFLEDAGGVFRRVMDAATATPQEAAIDGHDYVFGVDWGRQNDFTAIAVIDLDTLECVYLDRFTQIDYAVQIGRLNALVSKFRPVQIVAETNSMGGPLVEQLQMLDLPMRPFNTTNATKEAAIRQLESAFENGSIKIIPDMVMVGELQAYEQTKTATGKWTFSAPDGMHDDTVMALALAWDAATNAGPLIIW
jgi:phage terminase large subunit-like protein